MATAALVSTDAVAVAAMAAVGDWSQKNNFSMTGPFRRFSASAVGLVVVTSLGFRI